MLYKNHKESPRLGRKFCRTSYCITKGEASWSIDYWGSALYRAV